jgi:copper chaperone
MTSNPNLATFAVVGMTCGHCVASVTEEVSEVDGITSVDVDLATGRLTVASDAAIDAHAIKRAVETAGFQLAGTS